MNENYFELFGSTIIHEPRRTTSDENLRRAFYKLNGINNEHVGLYRKIHSAAMAVNMNCYVINLTPNNNSPIILSFSEADDIIQNSPTPDQLELIDEKYEIYKLKD